ncbi:MAG: DUF4230 domain-containing protein [Oscillospiraceae bacterium]|nr:DUF4230 domain-containing protein [Oscillospiraceae bacterium]
MKKLMYVFVTVFALAAAAGIVLWSAACLPEIPGFPKVMQEELPETVTPAAAPEPLNERETVTGVTITEALQDMEKLVTARYCFTEVVEHSSMKNLWVISGLTKSDFLISYDGTITAGVNLADAFVETDDAGRTVRVYLPSAEILSFSIDHDSFKKYHEREGLGNPITVDNYNEALQSVQSSMQEKAVQRGILRDADRNAESLSAAWLIHGSTEL